VDKSRLKTKLWPIRKIKIKMRTKQMVKKYFKKSNEL